ncbi:MAG: tetratricopeptide repeat protein [Nitrospirae bacterium]|nr:tetratricopeptide repeat protein [Nitrospirota bacterium]
MGLLSNKMADIDFLQKLFRPNKPWLPIFLIIFITLCVYLNSLGVPFQFDDIPNIVENVGLRGDGLFTRPWSYLSEIKATNIQGISGEAMKSRYLGYLSFALNYRIHGLEVVGYHLVNIAVHAANGVLVYMLVILIFGTPFMKEQRVLEGFGATMTALFSGLIFVVHPVQTQAVTYIVQRFASLAVMFSLLSIVMYGLWRQRQEEGVGGEFRTLLLYGCSIVFAVCAMKTKEMVFTLPLLVVLYEYMFYRGAVLKRLKWLVPIMLTMLIIPLSLLDTAKPVGEIIGDTSQATRLQSNLSRANYLFTEFCVMATYLRLLFMPVGQNLDYDYPVQKSFFNAEVLISLMLFLSLVALALYLWKASKAEGREELRIVSFGLFWYLIAHLVESGVIPIIDVVFEHRLYYPSVGFAIGFVGLVYYLAEVKSRYRRVAIVLMVVLVVTLGIASHMRNRVWQSNISLWEDVISKSPNKARGYLNLGFVNAKRFNHEKAIELYQKALLIDPYDEYVYSDIGFVYTEMGRYDDAINAFKRALSVNMADERAHLGLGDIYLKRAQAYSASGDINGARTDYQTACSFGNREACYSLQQLSQ